MQTNPGGRGKQTPGGLTNKKVPLDWTTRCSFSSSGANIPLIFPCTCCHPQHAPLLTLRGVVPDGATDFHVRDLPTTQWDWYTPSMGLGIPLREQTCPTFGSSEYHHLQKSCFGTGYLRSQEGIHLLMYQIKINHSWIHKYIQVPVSRKSYGQWKHSKHANHQTVT